MTRKRATITLAISLAIVSVSNCVAGGEPAKGADVKVVLCAKPHYRLGDRLEVAVKIENASKKPVYINPNLSDVFDAGLFLEVVDLHDRSAGPTISSHGRRPNYQGVDIATYIKQHWIRIEPGHFYGRNAVIPLHENVKPGTYRIKAIYQSILRAYLSAGQNDQVESLDGYALDGRVPAEPVEIRIVR